MSKGGGSSIPSDYTVSIGGSGTTLQVDYGLDDIHVKELPAFEVGVTSFPEITGNSNISVKELPDIVSTVATTSKIAITEIPAITTNLNIAVTQIPEQRVHYPAHYQVGFSLLGIEVWSLSLCGEAQVINEKYVPRRTEVCR
jgi:hypothetical protein